MPSSETSGEAKFSWFIPFLGALSALGPLSNDLYVPSLPLVAAGLGAGGGAVGIAATGTGGTLARVTGPAVTGPAVAAEPASYPCCQARARSSRPSAAPTDSSRFCPDARDCATKYPRAAPSTIPRTSTMKVPTLSA